MQIKNANTRNALRTNFCFLWRNNTTKKQQGQTKKTTTQHKGGRARARSGAWLTWHLPRHGMANLASQSWFLLLGTRHVASRDGHVECCEVVFFLSGHEFLSMTTQKGSFLVWNMQVGITYRRMGSGHSVF
ncbi:hypothetical protein BDL97_12G069600 [Sphagnum fallax]|nr:hypothetical protein BDL97_12G069600 [Sphagnum fallax]